MDIKSGQAGVPQRNCHCTSHSDFVGRSGVLGSALQSRAWDLSPTPHVRRIALGTTGTDSERVRRANRPFLQRTTPGQGKAADIIAAPLGSDENSRVGQANADNSQGHRLGQRRLSARPHFYPETSHPGSAGALPRR